MLLLSLEGPALDFKKKVFSACAVVSSPEGFYTMTPHHCHPKKTQRSSEKQLKLGNALLQSWPAGFRCRTFAAHARWTFAVCSVSKMCAVHLCLRPLLIQSTVISFNIHFVEVFWFSPRVGMFPSHQLKTTIRWVSCLMSSAGKMQVLLVLS